MGVRQLMSGMKGDAKAVTLLNKLCQNLIPGAKVLEVGSLRGDLVMGIVTPVREAPESFFVLFTL